VSVSDYIPPGLFQAVKVAARLNTDAKTTIQSAKQAVEAALAIYEGVKKNPTQPTKGIGQSLVNIRKREEQAKNLFRDATRANKLAVKTANVLNGQLQNIPPNHLSDNTKQQLANIEKAVQKTQEVLNMVDQLSNKIRGYRTEVEKALIHANSMESAASPSSDKGSPIDRLRGGIARRRRATWQWLNDQYDKVTPERPQFASSRSPAASANSRPTLLSRYVAYDVRNRRSWYAEIQKRLKQILYTLAVMEASRGKEKLVPTDTLKKDVMSSWPFPPKTLDTNLLDLRTITFNTPDKGRAIWKQMLTKLRALYTRTTGTIGQFRDMGEYANTAIKKHYSSTQEFQRLVNKMYVEKRRRIGAALDNELSERQEKQIERPTGTEETFETAIRYLAGYKIILDGDIKFIEQWIKTLQHLRDNAGSAPSEYPWKGKGGVIVDGGRGSSSSSSSSSSSRGGGGRGGAGESKNNSSSSSSSRGGGAVRRGKGVPSTPGNKGDSTFGVRVPLRF